MTKCPGEGISMTIIIVICAATVNMFVSLPACGGHGKREMVLKRTRWVGKPKSRQRAKHGPQMNRRHPVSTIHKMVRRHRVPANHLRTTSSREPPGREAAAPCQPYSASSSSRLRLSMNFLRLASYSSRVTTSSMRRLIPATSSPVISARRSVTRSFTSSKMSGA